MMDACIAARSHYCDITGEIDVIEAGASRDDRARAAGIAMMPAVGFDVAPTDCLAALLAAEMPTATKLELAFDPGNGQASPGTTKTMVENLPRGGFIRSGGDIVRVPTAHEAIEVPFSTGSRWAVTIPWGDVSSAFYSTGIGEIVVYLATPPKADQMDAVIASVVRIARYRISFDAGSWAGSKAALPDRRPKSVQSLASRCGGASAMMRAIGSRPLWILPADMR